MTVAAEAVGTLRLDAGRYPDDPATRQLVGELAMTSEDFRRWWADHRVVERSHGTKRMRHPIVGVHRDSHGRIDARSRRTGHRKLHHGSAPSTPNDGIALPVFASIARRMLRALNSSRRSDPSALSQ